MVDFTFIWPILFESVVGVALTFMLVKTAGRFFARKNPITKRLFLYLLIYWIAFVLSLFNQINRNIMEFAWFSQGPSDILVNVYFALAFSANWVFYQFFIAVFSEKEESKPNLVYLIFTISAVVYSIIFITTPSVRLYGSLILIVHSLVLYIPTTVKAYRSSSRIDESDPGKYAMLAIAIMSFFFVLGWTAIVANTIWESLQNLKYAPLFYFSWSFMLCAIISGYLGIIFPESFRKYILSLTARVKEENP
jgi:hypothetical protein